MSQKEQKRFVVSNGGEKSELAMVEAAEILGVSERQGWRLLAAYRKEGTAGFAHGNRGRKPVNCGVLFPALLPSSCHVCSFPGHPEKRHICGSLAAAQFMWGEFLVAGGKIGKA